jgi:hypothetical protein
MLEDKLTEEFLDYFKRLLSFYRDFLQLETEKYEVLLNNRLSLLDNLLRKEQAFVLKSKGLEQERRPLMERTQTPDAVFRDILPQFAPGKREQAQEIYDSLAEILLRMKKINSKCNSLTEIKMRQAKKAAEELKHNPELKQTIGSLSGAGETAETNGFLSKKI